MLSLGTILLVVPLLGDGTQIDVAAAVEAQTGAGVLPLLPDEPSTPALDSSLVFLSGMRTTSARTTFEISYRPRLVLQFPNLLDAVRPLLLHQVLLSYRSSLTERTAIETSIAGSAGEVSYIAQQQVFAPGSSPTELVPLVFGTVSSNLSHRTSRRNTVTAGLSSGYSAPLGSSEVDTAVFPESFDAAATLSDAYSLTQRDQLEVTGTSQYFQVTQYNPDVTLALDLELSTFGASVTWTHRLSERTSVGLTSGGALTYTLGTGEMGFIPEGTFLHDTNWRAGQTGYSSTFNAGVRGFLDRLAGTYSPQGFVSWSLGAKIGRLWTTGVSAFASTSLASEPVVPPQYESFGSLEQLTAFRVSQNAQLRFGVRSSVRGPHLRAEPAPSPTLQPEFLGFLGFRYGLGTDRQQGNWLK